MTQNELYKDILKLAPYHSAEDDFRENLSEALKSYTELLPKLDKAEQPNEWSSNVKQVSKRIEKIKEIARNSYKGLPSTAYTQLGNLLKDYKDQLLWVNIPKNSTFYRMRLIEGRRTNIEYKEMFHIPITKRRIVKTQRYSTPGFPCLYLGNSIYGCWEEMGRPMMSNCWVSRLSNNEEFQLLDLRVPDEVTFKSKFVDYIQLFPLLIASMIPVKDSEDIYKPEYIVPQLLIEWIIKEGKDGIYYTSAHKNMEFEFPPKKSDNIAMPVKEPLKNVANCPKLAALFKITYPLNNEIEQLKFGYPIDGGIIAPKDLLEENYRTSNFHYLEERLGKADLYDLK